MVIKRGKGVYTNLFFGLVLLIACGVVAVNFVIYAFYLNAVQSISAYTSNSAIVSLIVEGYAAPPNISIVSPLSQNYGSHITELKYIVSGQSLDKCWYSLSGGITNSSVTCGNNITGISSLEGANIWVVYVNDSLGNLNYSSVSFNVSITSASSVTPSTGGGGGVASLPTAKKRFEVEPKELNIFTTPGEVAKQSISVRNTGEGSLSLDLTVTGILNILILNTNRVILESGGEEEILLSVNGSVLGSFAGKLVLSFGNLKQEVFILVNVESKKKQFDVSITIPESEKSVSPGENLNTFVSFDELGERFGANLSVNYIIKDFEGRVLRTYTDSFYVFGEEGYAKEFQTMGLPEGDYVLSIEATYPGGFAVSSVRFSIYDAEDVHSYSVISIFFSIIAAVVIIFSIIRYRKSNKHLKTDIKRSAER